MRVDLLFPPGWTLSTGSPHLALPLLRAFLGQHGIECGIRDLNLESARQYVGRLAEEEAKVACKSLKLAGMNEPYFALEDQLMEVGHQYKGTWNAQIGFEYSGSPQESSRLALAALDFGSPFDDFYHENVVPELVANKPDVVGLCIAVTHQLIPALKLCRELRASGYNGFIVLGGNTISRLAKELSIPEVFRLVDGLVSFQGERVLVELCAALKERHCLSTVPQLVWNDEGTIRVNGQKKVADPEEVPCPNYDGLAVGEYWGVNYLNLVAARGCYYGKCDFCSIPFGWGGFSGVRSPRRVYQDMTTLADRFGVRRFKFVDEALSPSFMRALAEIVITEGARLEWEGYVRLEEIWAERKFVETVARGGFRKGYFGLEIVPSAKRKLLNKKDDVAPQALLERCSDCGVKVHFFCMFGFPGTGELEAAATTEFVLENQGLIDTADIFPWIYAKHTSVGGVQPIYDPGRDLAIEFGYSSDGHMALSSREVIELAERYEDRIWREVPRLLHPTYRLVSPWESVE